MLSTQFPEQYAFWWNNAGRWQLGYWWDNAGWALMIPSTTLDIPREGQLSNRMQDFLQYYDVVAIGEILKSRHVTTVQDLQSMKNSTKADVHSAAQFMYTKILHCFNDRRRKTMEAIFYVPTNFTTAASGHCDKKPKETTLKQELQSLELMNAGFAWFGPKMMELRHAVNQSESLSRLSLMLAVQAYTVVIVPEILKPAKWKKVDGEWVETGEMAEFKTLRATMRDGIAWRLIGFMLGIDSREAAESILKDLLCDIVSENPEEASPFAAVLHAYLMITRDVMRTVLWWNLGKKKIVGLLGFNTLIRP